jgi:hypothetical protein
MTRSWNVITGRLLIGLVVALGLWFMFQTEQSAPKSAESLAQDLAQDLDITRSAYKITLQDANLESGTVTFLHANRVTEKMSRILLLNDIVIDRTDKVHLKAESARYDLKLERLDVFGDIVVTTPDGIQGNLDTLTWDKASRRAWTDNPVRIITADGFITADKAVMLEDLDEISLIGDVYAKMADTAFRDKFLNDPAAAGR